MSLRRPVRVLGCAVLLVSVAACATAEQPARTPRPNEVQVYEPTGQEDKWTFTPHEIAVAKGTAVTFVNRGKELHTVTSDAAGRPFDLSINTNQTGAITFDTIGTWTYHCGIHPQMTGVVRVCEGACP